MGMWLSMISVEWLADGGPDIQWLVYIVLLLMSVVGGILQKQKKKKNEEQRRPQPGARPPQRRPVRPTKARPAQPPVAREPQPPRPARPIPPWRGAPEQPARRVPEPVEVLPPDIYTPAQLRRAQMEHRVTRSPKPDTVKGVEPQLRPVAVAARRARGPEPVLRARLQRMVRQRSQLRAAILMSEILGPPLALREDRGNLSGR